MPFLDELGLTSCGQSSGMMFVIVFQSLVNHCDFASTAKGLFDLWMLGGGGKLLYPLSLKEEILNILFC